MGINVHKVMVKVLVILAILTTAVLTVRAVLNYTMGRKLEAALRKAKADGFLLSGFDMTPACAETDNGASLWKAAEALIVLPKDKERTASVKAIESLFDGSPVDPESRKLLSDWVAKNRKVIELIDEASSMVCFRYDTSERPLFAKAYPDPIKLLQAARLLAIHALLRADETTWQEGLAGCRQGMRFFKNLADADASVLIMGLTAVADLKMLVAGFNRIVQGRDMNTADLVALMKEFDAGAWRNKFARFIRVERIFGLEWGLARIAGDPEVLEARSFPGRAWERGRDWLIRPLLKWEVRRNFKMSLEIDKLLLLPYYEQREVYDRLVAHRIMDHRPVFMKEATLEAMMLTTKAGLACKIYRNMNGRYPDHLEALVPSIVDELPVDPFTGKPLVYRFAGDEVLVYSVGSNGRDDGGRETYQITQLVMEKDDDWAWREKVR
jgi:hypothetical protein